MLIFLIGFMGSGKSYSARKLSEAMNMNYVDMDKEIERLEGRSIREIFEKGGEDYFRKLEHDYLKDLNTDQDLIVSTGGGAPCFFDNMKIIKEKGLSIYLNIDEDVIFRRLKKGVYKRPLLKDLTDEALADFISEKIKLRTPYYSQADLVIDQFNASQLVKTIISWNTSN